MKKLSAVAIVTTAEGERVSYTYRGRKNAELRR